MKTMNNKQMREYMGEMLKNAHEVAVAMFTQPWVNATVGYRSYNTGKKYSDGNQFLLWLQGAPEGEYATFNTIKKSGGKVKKGAKAKHIIFADSKVAKKVVNEETGEEEVRTYPLWKVYDVFHIGTDTEDIEQKHQPEPMPNVVRPVSEMERMFKAYFTKYGVECHKSKMCNEAFYNPSSHSITLPMMKQFKSKALYYSVKCHETVHSTGHKTILNRIKKGTKFGSEEYSREELVAELGAATILKMFGIDTEQSVTNSKAYINSWTQAIKDDPMMVITGINNASKAVKVITECMAVA